VKTSCPAARSNGASRAQHQPPWLAPCTSTKGDSFLVCPAFGGRRVLLRGLWVIPGPAGTSRSSSLLLRRRTSEETVGSGPSAVKEARGSGNASGGMGNRLSNQPQPVRRRRSTAREVEDHLRAELDAGRWSAGERLPSETALAAELGVGRSSVREAIQALAREGLVVVSHGTGTFACAPSEAFGAARVSVADMLRRAHIVEVFEVRRGLEVEAARLAAARASTDPDAVRELTDILEQRHGLVGQDTTRFVQADLRFHRAVVDLAGNALLSQLFDQLYEPLRIAITALTEDEAARPDTRNHHSVLLDAIRHGDPTRAAEAAAQHFEVIIRFARDNQSAPQCR